MSNSPLSQRNHFGTHNNRAQNTKTCRFCFKTFSKTEHLSRHERSHTKERPYRCDDCGKSYSRNDTLLRHRRAHEKAAEEPETPSDDAGGPSPDRVDDAATTLLNLQSLTEYQNEPEIGSNPREFHTMEYQDPRGCAAELSHIDPRLSNGDTQNISSGIDMDFASNGLLDPQLQQYSINTQSNSYSFSPQMGPWNMQNESFPSWHIPDDFDIEAFNLCLRSPVYTEQHALNSPSSIRQENELPPPRMEVRGQNPLSVEEIQRLWITKTENNSWKTCSNSYSVAPTRPISPTTESPPGNRVDERYREDLSLKLTRPRWKEYPLPSSEFLNLALQLFFTKFNPVFPILHEPTFRPSNHNSLLLLSICSIGSLFMGSSTATSHGSKIFERINKVILASWENVISKNTPERTSVVQAAVIGQTFAYLSGNPQYLATVEVFHGTVIAFARRCGFFNTTPKRTLPDLGNGTQQELEEAWAKWARSEEILRTTLVIYVHDAQFASTFHNDPMMRHRAIRLPSPVEDKLFAATNATQWASIVRSTLVEPTTIGSHLHVNQPEHSCSNPLQQELACKSSRFACYIILHGIGAAVMEHCASGHMQAHDVSRYQDALMCWHHAYEETRPPQESDPLCLMVLFHEIFMSLLVDFNQLERAIGRDGPSATEDALKYVRKWSTSTEAKRCVIHASLIYRQTAGMRVDSEPAIHVPKAMFQAAIAWYCYIQFDPVDSTGPQSLPESLDIPEAKFWNVNPPQLLYGAGGFKTGKPKLSEAGTLCGLTDLLYRIGHWGISRRLARILGLLVHGDPDSHLVDTA